tara:strand:+ start:215 stop:784 length:570 start_codon:yes stop_codon:yes gene_type:complete
MMSTLAEPVSRTYPRYIKGRPTKLLTVWKNAKARCRDYPNIPCWHRYGGRGIDICNEWYDSYDVFAGWCMDNGWKDGLTIDRIDNERNYSPDNVRFVTLSENVKNRKRTQAQRDNDTGNNNLKVYWAKVKSGEIEQERWNNRSVICVETGDVYKTASSAGRAFGFGRGACANAISSGGKMGGYHWKDNF